MVDYCTTAQVKSSVNKTITAKDPDIARVITAISRMIDKFCNRADDGFVASAIASIHYYAGRGEGVLRIDETPEITEVAVKESSSDTTYTAWATADWIAFRGDPGNPDFNHTPYTGVMAAWGSGLIFTSGLLDDDLSWSGARRGLSGRSSRRGVPPTVRVTAKWGYSLTTPPPEIAEACITETARLVKQAEGNYADALLSEALGRMIMAAKLHPSTENMLLRFKRVSVG